MNKVLDTVESHDLGTDGTLAGRKALMKHNEQRDRKSIIAWRDTSLNSNVNDNAIINEDYFDSVLNNLNQPWLLKKDDMKIGMNE